MAASSIKIFGTSEAVEPTVGFSSLPLKKSNFQIQRPYDMPEDQRYSFIDGVHKLWVFKTDKPHSPESHTKPRTEIRILVSIYSAVYTNLFMCIYKLHHMYIYTLDKIWNRIRIFHHNSSVFCLFFLGCIEYSDVFRVFLFLVRFFFWWIKEKSLLLKKEDIKQKDCDEIDNYFCQ